MNTTQVSIDELRTNLAEIIGKVMYGDNQIVVSKYNREAAVIISKEEYERLKDPTRRLTNEQWKNGFKKLDAIRRNIPKVDSRIIEKEINRAVKEVREQKRKIKP